MAYVRDEVEVRAMPLVLRKGYASSLTWYTSLLHIGLGGWLGPNGGGFDILKFGVTIRRFLPDYWDAPFHLGFATLVFDQVEGRRNLGILAPYGEWSLLVGTRHLKLGPGVGLQYRWLFGARDDLQVTVGLAVSYTTSEKVWKYPDPGFEVNNAGGLVRSSDDGVVPAE